MLEAAAKTLETGFEDADSDFIAVPSEEMERCKSFLIALSRAKEQLGLAPLSNRDELNAWLISIMAILAYTNDLSLHIG